MRVAVIGGTGHIGTWLTPMLVAAGHDVVCCTRGLREPYQPHEAFERVERCFLDRNELEAAGEFGKRIAALSAETVVDLTCYKPASAEQLVEALRGRVRHFLHCGTIWVHGPTVETPTREDAIRLPFGDYGCRKAAIEQYLMGDTGFPATVLNPGHLVGPGWPPINPAGNFNLDVWVRLAQGREVLLPNFGMETLHHVHASDVASAFVQAIAAGEPTFGESYHVVSAAALTMRGYAERMAEWFGQPAHLRFLPWEKWRSQASEKDARVTLDHMQHSPNCSIEKAGRAFGYAPRYSSLAAVQESLKWLMENGAFTAASG